MMIKFVSVLLVLLMTSGCCELFGICTSVNVHTSAPSPNEFARTDSMLTQSSGAVPYARPGSATITNQSCFPPG